MPKLGYKTRRALSVVLILIWLPIYIILAISVLSRLPEWSIVIKLIIYIVAAFLWMVPFRFVFQGVGKADPEASPTTFLDDNFTAQEKTRQRHFGSK